MPVETFNYIDSLNTANPTATDNVSEGDDHIRGIKTTLKNTFPNVNGAINATDEELNYVDGVTSAIQTQLDAKVDDTDIGVTVQAYDADTAKTDVAQTFTATQSFGDIALNTSGDSNASKAIVVNTSGVNFESDGGIIQVTHAGAGATTGGYFMKLSSGGTDKFTVKGNGDVAITGNARTTLTTDNDGSFSMASSNNFKCTPTANFTLSFTNIASQSGFILLVNTGGHTVSAAATTKVDANMLATVSTAGTYLLSYFSDSTNVYLTNSAAYT